MSCFRWPWVTRSRLETAESLAVDLSELLSRTALREAQLRLALDTQHEDTQAAETAVNAGLAEADAAREERDTAVAWAIQHRIGSLHLDVHALTSDFRGRIDPSIRVEWSLDGKELVFFADRLLDEATFNRLQAEIDSLLNIDRT